MLFQFFKIKQIIARSNVAVIFFKMKFSEEIASLTSKTNTDMKYYTSQGGYMLIIYL